MSVRRKYIWALVVSVGLLSAYSLYRWLSPGEESVEEVARKCLAYIESRDARSLIRYVSDWEKDLLELDEEKLQVFLNFLWERLEGFTPQGEPKLDTTSSGMVTILRKYAHPDGRRTAVGCDVAVSDRGPKVEGLIAVLSHTIWKTYTPVHGWDWEVRAYVVSKSLPDFERLPIRGFVDFNLEHSRGVMEPRVWTWREWADRAIKQWQERRKRTG
jgi:hypothetical protein